MTARNASELFEASQRLHRAERSRYGVPQTNSTRPTKAPQQAASGTMPHETRHSSNTGGEYAGRSLYATGNSNVSATSAGSGRADQVNCRGEPMVSCIVVASSMTSQRSRRVASKTAAGLHCPRLPAQQTATGYSNHTRASSGPYHGCDEQHPSQKHRCIIVHRVSCMRAHQKGRLGETHDGAEVRRTLAVECV